MKFPQVKQTRTPMLHLSILLSRITKWLYLHYLTKAVDEGAFLDESITRIEDFENQIQ